MDYLRSFTIGSSGLVTFQFFAYLVLQDKNYFNPNFKLYSFVAPIYFGIMNMLSLKLSKSYNLSLAKRLFIFSIISVVLVTMSAFIYMRPRYRPYNTFTSKDWLSYLFRNGSRHVIAFNLIIFYFEKYFSDSELLRAFVIGSSLFPYLISYHQRNWLDKKIDYNLFATFSPLFQGLFLMGIVLLKNNFQIKFQKSLIIAVIISSIIWFLGSQQISPQIVILNIIKYNLLFYSLGKHLR